MTAFRLIPLPIHAALRVLSGLVLMVLPFLLGFDPAGIVIGVTIGAVVMGVALRAVDAGERRSVSPGELHAFDYATVLVVLVAAVALGAVGDPTAALALGIAAAVLLGGNLLTRYSARG